jgi:ankyrin repeat protein
MNYIKKISLYAAALIISSLALAMDLPVDSAALNRATAGRSGLTFQRLMGSHLGVVDNIGSDGEFPLIYAIKNAAVDGNIVIVDCLIKTFKTDVNIKDQHGHSPLFYALNTRRENIVVLLRQHGAILNLAEANFFDNDPEAQKLLALDCPIMQFSSIAHQPVQKQDIAPDDELELALRLSRQEPQHNNVHEDDFERALRLSMLEPQVDAHENDLERALHLSKFDVKAHVLSDEDLLAYALAESMRADPAIIHDIDDDELFSEYAQKPKNIPVIIQDNLEIHEAIENYLNKYPLHNHKIVWKYFQKKYNNLSEDQFYDIYIAKFKLKYDKIMDLVGLVIAQLSPENKRDDLEIVLAFPESVPTALIDYDDMGDPQLQVQIDGKNYIFTQREIALIIDFIANVNC